jgi:hypothetical protein
MGAADRRTTTWAGDAKTHAESSKGDVVVAAGVVVVVVVVVVAVVDTGRLYEWCTGRCSLLPLLLAVLLSMLFGEDTMVVAVIVAAAVLVTAQ